MPENSPSRTTPNHHPATKALEIRARELDILARTGIDASKLSARAEDKPTRLILESHQQVLTHTDTPVIVLLNGLRHATQRLQNGDTPEEVQQSLIFQGFGEQMRSLGSLSYSPSQNGSKDGTQ